MCFIEPDGQYDFHTEKLVRARKPHKCIECEIPIHIGELHWIETYKWEGEVMRHREHVNCRDLRQKIANHEMDEGCGAYEAYPPLGYLREALRAYGLVFEIPAAQQTIIRNEEIETQDIGF
jgi:hypothetical protein